MNTGYIETTLLGFKRVRNCATQTNEPPYFRKMEVVYSSEDKTDKIYRDDTLFVIRRKYGRNA